jgi:hypothetical protein
MFPAIKTPAFDTFGKSYPTGYSWAFFDHSTGITYAMLTIFEEDCARWDVCTGQFTGQLAFERAVTAATEALDELHANSNA